jgi:hypothetical protein
MLFKIALLGGIILLTPTIEKMTCCDAALLLSAIDKFFVSRKDSFLIDV